ncbi:hypothetical protein EST38_g1686 [Candolleomyces aberdarensis]|uniref:Uncharacterized protein n=1 Tax=Candolleomyces aberdarensis TaxID=2316362 RepID=A0A4Q2DVA8_9AGAR|nr:hypothetical protein EST38_g1686 [Candolleomyces aberdarensis]
MAGLGHRDHGQHPTGHPSFDCNSFSQTTQNLNPTPDTKSKRTSESREKRARAIDEGTSAKDHKAEVNSIVDSLDEQEEAHGQWPTHRSTIEEPSSFKLNARATIWQWDPTVSANPTLTTASSKGDTDILQPQELASDWEAVQSKSVRGTRLTDTAPLDGSAGPSYPMRPKPSEGEYYTSDSSPPPQATLGSSSSQTPSRLNGSLPEYFPSDGSEWMPEKAFTALDGVAPHFQTLIDVLWDFQSLGITSVDRGGTLLNLLQQRDPYILVAAGTAGYKSPFALYLQEAYEAGIISSPTGRVQLASGCRYWFRNSFVSLTQ